MEAALVYLVFNLVVNGLLACTREFDLAGLLALRDPDIRLSATYYLARHLAWHDSWLEEQAIPALVLEVAAEEGMDPALLQALVEVESGGRPHVVSPAGACGLTQIMPGTARALGVQDPFDPRENLAAGARYLQQMRSRFGGDLALALAAYNAGPGAVLAAGGVPDFPETRRYVRRVRQRYAALSRRPDR